MAMNALTVIINGEQYRLDQMPASHSTLVKEYRNSICGAAILKYFIQDLGHLSKYIRIAYNGLAGCTELQIKIHRIGYDTNTLCDALTWIFGSFSSSSKQILHDLYHCYDNLISGSEDVAVQILSNFAIRAERMATESTELRDKFIKLADEVRAILEETIAASDGVRHQTIVLNGQLHSSDERKQHTSPAVCYWLPGEILKSIANVMDSSDRNVELTDDDADSVRKKMTQLDAMQNQSQTRIQLLQQVGQLARSIPDMAADVELAQGSITLMHSGLSELSVIMCTTAEFWDQMHRQCEQIRFNEEVIAWLENQKRKPLEERTKIWKSQYFRHKVVREYAKWVALGHFYTDCCEQVKRNQADLCAFLRENATVEEGRKLARECARNLANEIEESHKQLVIEFQNRALEQQRLMTMH